MAFWKRTFTSMLAGIFFPAAVCGHDGTVSVDGLIQDNTCELSPDSATQTVDMGTGSRGQFSGIGDKSPAKPFSIHLQNCRSAASEATIAFSGTLDPVNPDLFDLDGGPEATSGLALGIYEMDGALLRPGYASTNVGLQTGQT